MKAKIRLRDLQEQRHEPVTTDHDLATFQVKLIMGDDDYIAFKTLIQTVFYDDKVFSKVVNSKEFTKTVAEKKNVHKVLGIINNEL